MYGFILVNIYVFGIFLTEHRFFIESYYTMKKILNVHIYEVCKLIIDNIVNKNKNGSHTLFVKKTLSFKAKHFLVLLFNWYQLPPKFDLLLTVFNKFFDHWDVNDFSLYFLGKHIMQAVVLILESDNNADVKEQGMVLLKIYLIFNIEIFGFMKIQKIMWISCFFTALCILANIADGDNAKSYIMANEDVLKKVTNYLMHTNTKLQMAAGKFHFFSKIGSILFWLFQTCLNWCKLVQIGPHLFNLF